MPIFSYTDVKILKNVYGKIQSLLGVQEQDTTTTFFFANTCWTEIFCSNVNNNYELELVKALCGQAILKIFITTANPLILKFVLMKMITISKTVARDFMVLYFFVCLAVSTILSIIVLFVFLGISVTLMMKCTVGLLLFVCVI